MAQEAWRAYLELALGMTEASRKKAAKAVKRFAGKGGATAEQLQTLAEDLFKAGASNREALTRLIRTELDHALDRVGLVRGEEVAELTERIRKLEEQLGRVRADSSGSAAGIAAAKAAGAPAPAAPPAAPVRKVAKKAVKKAPAGAAIAPGAASNAAAKRATAKAATASKATAKKAPGKRAAATKTTVAKRAAAKQPPAPAGPQAGATPQPPAAATGGAAEGAS